MPFPRVKVQIAAFTNANRVTIKARLASHLVGIPHQVLRPWQDDNDPNAPFTATGEVRFQGAQGARTFRDRIQSDLTTLRALGRARVRAHVCHHGESNTPCTATYEEDAV